MSRREAWRDFLQGVGSHDGVDGVLVVDGEGAIKGRYGQADVFSEEAIDCGGGEEADPNSQDVWMDEVADRIVLVAFERGGDVDPIKRAVKREADRVGLRD